MDLDPWPLRHLELRTPRLSLRPDDDVGLRELAALALRGVHPPEEMPFSVPWTDQPPGDVVRGTLRHHWEARASLQPDRWSVHFLVRHEGRVIGTQMLCARDFPITLEVSSGSWIGQEHQRRGYGTEARLAVLLLAFDHLGALGARSGAFTDNFASQRISERLGYRRDGTATHARRGARATELRYLLVPEALSRPSWSLEVDGLDACRTLLGC